jgi:hypothetical protein
MITPDLVSYIRAQTKKNVGKDIIISRLIRAGWHPADILEGLNVSKMETEALAQPAPNVVSESPVTQEAKPIAPIMKASVPSDLVEKTPASETDIKETKDQNLSVAQSYTEIESHYPESLSEIRPVSPQPELPSYEEAMVKPYVIPTNTIGSNSRDAKDLFPELVSKPKLNLPSDTSAVKNPIQPSVATPSSPAELSPMPIEQPILRRIPENDSSLSLSLPKRAMISSYGQDILAANQESHEIFKKKEHTWAKRLIAALIVVAVLGGAAAVVFGYIKNPFSFIKKDPKVSLINTPAMLHGLKSYKVDTTVTISLPTVADITAGLVSGQAVSNHDSDSVSIRSEGAVNHDILGKTVFDYKTTLVSSILKNSIATDVTYDGTKTYVAVPDLRQLFGVYAPPATIVSVEKGKFDAIIPELPRNIEDIIAKIDIYKIMSNGLPLHAETDTYASFKEFINNISTTVEKDPEDIHGIPTYHYALSPDRQVTKDFLTKIADIFIVAPSSAEKKNLDEILGSVNMESFEVWVGKSDRDVHQFAVTLTAPLSKIIGLNDKGIANSDVTLEWKTSYYDFDADNAISAPEASVPIEDFVKLLHDIKIKNIIYSFKPIAGNLRNAEGSFGLSPNASGSCTNPAQGSLFSPLGHRPGAASIIGNLAGSMNDIIAITNQTASCYSTANAWAIAAPLTTDPLSSFCVDSTGASGILAAALDGTACKI